MPLLEVRDLEAGYGPIRALDRVSIDVEDGELVALIGANGAGKTTLLMAISGVVPPRGGSIRFAGASLGGLQPHEVMRLGVGHAPEGRRIFPRLTVRENLELGGTLSGGEQQMLAIARAIVGHPRLLLLDEPSLGLAPLIVAKVFEVIASLSARGIAVLLVEQNARAALKLANRGYVLETGRITLTGSGAELAADRRVRDAYLGEG